LYTGNWSAAENQSTSLIASSLYSLLTTANIGNAFLINSPETIWEIASDKSNTAEGSIFIPSGPGVKPTYALTNSLLSSFEVGDQRKSKWTSFNTVGIAYYYPLKYKEKSATTPVKEYDIVFRLPEIYLIRAEARARQNAIAESRLDLNSIRIRAGIAGTAANSQAALLTLIEKERQTELFSEWGHRLFDLKRTNRADAVLSVAKAPTWQSTDTLFPIPFTEMQYNVALTQNPGY
jgi:hypothetical protein